MKRSVRGGGKCHFHWNCCLIVAAKIVIVQNRVVVEDQLVIKVLEAPQQYLVVLDPLITGNDAGR